jgi:hypothetical protein
MVSETQLINPLIATLQQMHYRKFIQKPVNKTAFTTPSTNSSLFEKPLSDNPIVETTTGTTTIFAKNCSNNTTALYIASKGTLTSDPYVNYIESITSFLLLSKLINIKRLMLNKLSNSLKIVLEALKTQNTDRIINFMFQVHILYLFILTLQFLQE